MACIRHSKCIDFATEREQCLLPRRLGLRVLGQHITILRYRMEMSGMCVTFSLGEADSMEMWGETRVFRGDG